MQVIDYMLSLGSTVFVPIVLIVLGLVFGQPFLKSLKSGITVGIGFIGLNLAITLISNVLEPCVKQIVDRFGFHLTVIDVGSGAAAGVAFSSVIGALIIPCVFLLNVVLLAFKLTKTMNIDIFNYSHYAFSGAVVHLITKSVPLAIGVSLIQATWSLLSADYTAKAVQEDLGVEGISIPQGYAASSVPLFVLLDKLYDKIPKLRDSKMDLTSIQNKIGMLGDPIVIGVFLGIVFSLLSGYNFADGANLVMGICAIMLLFPRMVKIIVEGLMPISESARKFFAKRFKGREVYIGLDSAITLGLPATQIIGTLLIPITLILAVILPGNKVLPLADLAFAAFFVCMATIIHKGNMLKTLISGIINMVGILYLATWFAPYFTELSKASDAATKGDMTALWAGNVFAFIGSIFGGHGWIGLLILVAVTIIVIVYVGKHQLRKEKPSGQKLTQEGLQ